MKKVMISTNAFEAYEISNNIVIEEKNLAYRKMGFLVTIIGAVCVGFSYLIVDPPLKKMLFTILEYGLFYGGLLALFGGMLYLIRSLGLLKPAKVIFDTEKKELKIRGRRIAFDVVKDLHCVNLEYLGRNNIKIRFREKGLRVPLILVPISDVAKYDEIKIFVARLNEILGN